jgi:hypothetical protein
VMWSSECSEAWLMAVGGFGGVRAL